MKKYDLEEEINSVPLEDMIEKTPGEDGDDLMQISLFENLHRSAALMMQAIKSKRGVFLCIIISLESKGRDGISATIVADRGDEVSGSDIEKYIFTQQPLEERHIPITSFSADIIHGEIP